ncbi:MAG: hypothetical protein Q7K29_08690, partial [Thermoleophilia bacterium]|nr:hypothetical protein [Thermoleophilia bacterium]
MKLIGFIRHNVNLLILLICAIVLMLIAITQPPERRGDGSEYFQMMLSLSNHGTPDLRESDITEYNLLRDKTAKTSVSFEQDKTSNLASNSGYVKTKSGKTYSVHFWFYSLAAVPAKWYLQTTGLDGFKAFQITNALLLIFALYAVLFESGFSKYKKWLFSALVLFSPAL